MADDYAGRLREKVEKVYDKAVEKRCEEEDFSADKTEDRGDGASHDSGYMPDGGRRVPHYGELMDIKSEYLKIFEWFEGFDTPDLDANTAVVTACQNALNEIMSSSSNIAYARENLGDWHGEALTSFDKHCAAKLDPDGRDAHKGLLEGLLGAVTANQETIECKRRQAEQLADQAYEVLADLDTGGSFDDEIALGVGLLFVAGGVAGLAGFGVAGAAQYIIGSSTSGGKALTSVLDEGQRTIAEKEPTVIEGGSVAEILESLRQATVTLNAKVDEANEKILESCKNNLQTVQANQATLVPRPSLDPTDRADRDRPAPPELADINEDTKNPGDLISEDVEND